MFFNKIIKNKDKKFFRRSSQKLLKCILLLQATGSYLTNQSTNPDNFFYLIKK